MTKKALLYKYKEKRKEEKKVENEELLVKRALEGKKIFSEKGFFKKINLESLREELEALAPEDWLKLCYISDAPDPDGWCRYINFYGFGYSCLFYSDTQAKILFLKFLDEKKLWESEEDKQNIVDMTAGKKYRKKYLEDYKKKDGFYTWYYLKERQTLIEDIVDMVRYSRRAKDYDIKLEETKNKKIY